jgi:hypothetical protein
MPRKVAALVSPVVREQDRLFLEFGIDFESEPTLESHDAGIAT